MFFTYLHMDSFTQLQERFAKEKLHIIIAADAEPVVSVKKNGKITSYVPAGGVAVALEPLARASNAVYIARGKTEEEKRRGEEKVKIGQNGSQYELKRLFLSNNEMNGYYYGFANQTLWPMMHVAFERPIFHRDWFDTYKRVNAKFARAIQAELKSDSVIWINDYQLALVPSLLKRTNGQSVGFFWHIPWPTWEIFRILPEKKEILESLLKCDFIAFHRGYQAENFLETVERELEARIERETKRVFYKNHITTVVNLPMGIDVDVVKSLATEQLPEQQELKPKFFQFLQRFFPKKKEEQPPVKELPYKHLFKKYRVMLGVDRLDYTKGLRKRLEALDVLLTKYPKYKKKLVYMGILSPSREQVPAYKRLKYEVFRLAAALNRKHRTTTWKPIHLLSAVLSRQTLMQLYKKADVCLVTPLDDGMNLVSKEFVCAASTSDKPGMIVLSQFAGSAIDLTEGLIVNPYDTDGMAQAIDAALSMSDKEKRERISMMEKTLETRNVYTWIERFVERTQDAARQNRKMKS